MKTLQECKDEVAQVNGYKDWENIHCNLTGFFIDDVSELYAKEVAQQALIDASENLEPNNCYYNGSHCDLDAHRKEILNTPIKLL
jgi:hypothetical protein